MKKTTIIPKKKSKRIKNKKLNKVIKHDLKTRVKNIISIFIKWLQGSFVIPRMAVLAGLIGAVVFLIVPKIFEKSPQPQPVVPIIDPSIPLNIEIPRLGINLPIKEATVSANDWQVYDDAVSWLKDSGSMSGGNVVLYGHNKKTLFGSIIQLGKGDQIMIKGSTGNKSYVVEKSYQTHRWDLTAITAASDQLTMYTCSGWFDANRWFVIAKPLSNR